MTNEPKTRGLSCSSDSSSLSGSSGLRGSSEKRLIPTLASSASCFGVSGSTPY